MLNCIEQICLEYLPIDEALFIKKSCGTNFDLHSYYKNVNIIRWFDISNNEKDTIKYLIKNQYIEVLKHLSRTDYIFNSNQTSCIFTNKCLICIGRLYFSNWMEVIRILYSIGVRHFCYTTIQHIINHGDLKLIDYFMNRELYRKHNILSRCIFYSQNWKHLKYFIDMGGKDLDTKTQYNILNKSIQCFGLNKNHIVLYLYTKVHMGKDRMYTYFEKQTVKELKDICRLLKLPQWSYLTTKKQLINYILKIGRRYIIEYLDTITYAL